MIDVNVRKEVIRKMTEARRQILMEQPFYGHLAMNLTLSVSVCGTAFTDMRRIAFDPDFAKRLSMEEMKFVFLHEVLHCVLNHCVRGREYDQLLFNIACDIVVNSNILYSLGIDSFQIDGTEVMHLAPNKKEGYLYNAETVYEMLLHEMKEKEDLKFKMEHSRSKTDAHDAWEKIEKESLEADKWKEKAKNAGKQPGAARGLPPSLRDYEEELNRKSRLSWRELLKDFIQVYCDQYDYVFHPGDRRYAEYDFVLPAFDVTEGERVENIWFAVDTSASITDDQLSLMMDEIAQCLLQMGNFEAMISFFDTFVTEPISFHDRETLKKAKPKGGGGTSFYEVFSYMKEHMADQLPSAVIFMTDGEACYPPEKAALGVPVLWMIVESNIEPPWGTVVHVEF